MHCCSAAFCRRWEYMRDRGGYMFAHVGFYRLDGALVYCICGDKQTRILM